MNDSPTTYSEWSRLLDQFAQEPNELDERLLGKLGRGAIQHGPAVTPRLVDRITELINARLKHCTAALQRALDRSGGIEANVVSALIAARKHLTVPAALAELPALPAEVRSKLKHSLGEYVNRVNMSLIESARSDATGRIAHIVRHNPVKLDRPECGNAPVEKAAPSRLGRRVIL